MTWAEATAVIDAQAGADHLRALAREYMAEADLWGQSPTMHRSLVDTAGRLAWIAERAVERAIGDPSFCDVVDAFVYGGRLQLDHVQSTRRFAYGEAPHVIPRRAGRE